MSREVMQIALDMLNEIADDVYCDQKLEGVITILRQALDTDLARVGEVGVWGECEPQEEVEDGWCNWVCPKPQGYLMQCCDCGNERCEEHPDHQTGMISERMIQERMQEEIDELRQALEKEQEPGAWISERGDVFLLVNGIWMKWDLSCES